jgi:hypothetical protein
MAPKKEIGFEKRFWKKSDGGAADPLTWLISEVVKVRMTAPGDERRPMARRRVLGQSVCIWAL